MMPPRTVNGSIKNYRTVILDFDGVIVESNDIKNQAFEAVFAKHPKQIPAIRQYHRGTTCIRFAKFRHIVEHILHESYTPARELELSKAFSNFCVEKIMHCPWVKGAPEFLAYFAKRVPLYLVSINPADDLDCILRQRDLHQYFKGVYTADKCKAGQIKDILSKEGISAVEAVYIGDAVNDYTSAQQAGVDFIGRRSNAGLDLKDVPVYDDLSGVMDHLKGCVACPTI